MAANAAAVLATSDSGSPFDENNKRELKRLQEVRVGSMPSLERRIELESFKFISMTSEHARQLRRYT